MSNTEKQIPAPEEEQDFRKLVWRDLSLDGVSLGSANLDVLEDDSNQVFLRDLFERQNIDLTAFNVVSGKNLSFYQLHYKAFEQKLESLTPHFTYLIWRQGLERELFTTRISELTLLAQEISNLVALEITVDYHQKAVKAIFDQYGVWLTTGEDFNRDFESVFSRNKIALVCSRYQLECLSEKQRSLLYFDLSEKELLAIRRSLQSNRVMEMESSEAALEEKQDESIVGKKIVEMEPSSSPKKKEYGGKSGGKQGKRRARINRKLKDEMNNKVGKQAEEEVLAELQLIYSKRNVIWLSEYSDYPDKGDFWGYDMKYRKDENSPWQYVEVKSFKNGYFYFTSNELKSAKKNRGNYYLFLVNEKNIKKLLFDKFLDSEGELIIDNGFFTIENSEYKFLHL